MTWARGSVAVTQRSTSPSPISINPAPSARNSALAPSTTCCMAGSRPLWRNWRSCSDPMLLRSASTSMRSSIFIRVLPMGAHSCALSPAVSRAAPQGRLGWVRNCRDISASNSQDPLTLPEVRRSQRSMLMPDIDTVRGWQGRTMVDGGGDRIGSIEGIYADDQSGEPEWALVNTGLFGTKSTFVPIVQASERNGDVQVPYDKQLVKDAPRIEADQHLSEAEEQQLWRHYGLDYGAGQAGTAAQRQPDTEEIDRPVGAAAGGRRAGDDTAGRGVNEAMTRSEEELRVGTETRQRGRARLRKYVTTETQQVTVPVQREE